MWLRLLVEEAYRLPFVLGHPRSHSEGREHDSDEAVDRRLLAQVLHALAQLLEQALGLFVEGVVDQLSVDVPRHTTKLGAGSGVWEDPAYVTSFAAVTGLDYIDIHSYPLTEGVTDYLKNLETWPAVVRAINPSLEIISSESWLYKAQAVELGGPPVNAALLSRDVYSFWEPLDNQYLEVLAITAHKENYSIVAPFRSNYFFAYLDYHDPSLPGLDPMELYDRAYSAAYQAVLAGQTTGLGRAYGEIAAGVSP